MSVNGEDHQEDIGRYGIDLVQPMIPKRALTIIPMTIFTGLWFFLAVWNHLSDPRSWNLVFAIIWGVPFIFCTASFIKTVLPRNIICDHSSICLSEWMKEPVCIPLEDIRSVRLFYQPLIFEKSKVIGADQQP